jgi:hypothetical protein
MKENHCDLWCWRALGVGGNVGAETAVWVVKEAMSMELGIQISQTQT